MTLQLFTSNDTQACAKTAQANTSIFKVRNNDPLKTKIFLDPTGTVDISRSDIVKYPIFKKQAEAMFSNFWRPEEIVLGKDKTDFETLLKPHEQFIFTTGLKRAIIIDSEQSMALSQAFLPVCSDPMVKRCVNYMTQQEEVHSSAYEHIVKNVYLDSPTVFDQMSHIAPIIHCGKDIARYYDDLILEIAKYKLGLTTAFCVKTKIWLCLHSINALEGIRFFNNFTTFFNFGSRGEMVGNASEIKLIAADELLHVAFTTALIRTLPEDDPDFELIKRNHEDTVTGIFLEVNRQEKEEYIPFLFSQGSMVGQNEKILSDYSDFRTAKCMRAVGLEVPFDAPKSNPVPSTNKWLNEGDMQPAPQETEVTSYVQNGHADVSEDTFSGIEL